MRLVQSIQSPGLERPDRKIVAEQTQELRADERLTQPAMNEEERRRAARLLDRNQDRHRFCGPRRALTAPVDIRGDAGDGRILVDLRQAHSELLEQARLHLNQRKRVAAQQEEIVVTSHRSLLEQRLKYFSHPT